LFYNGKRGEAVRSLIIIILFFLASCAKEKTAEVASAVDLAQTYLSYDKCDDAIKVLEEVGRQNTNAIYLQVLASAYACRAGFSEINFLVNDIDSLSSPELMKALSTLSLSNELITDSAKYADIRTAINILLNADQAAQPLQSYRTALYGSRKAGDIGVQILMLTIVQWGKFLNHFGSVNDTGEKGLRTGQSNACFLNYSYPQAQAIINGLPATNNCNSNNDGHPDLDLTTAAGKKRACEGLMIITNLIDILNNIDLSGSDSLGPLADLTTVASDFKVNAEAADSTLATLLNITSQAVCETTLGSASEVDKMQMIYALIFEAGLE
jgi:hypothetical protein